MVDVSQILERMHPLREPPPPDAILPALIMTTIGAFAAIAILVAIWQARHRGGALRRAAEVALAASRQLAPADRLAAQAQLLRRLVRGLDGEAKSMSKTQAPATLGQAWLERLDTLFATSFFTQGPGVAYGEALYRPQITTDIDALDQSLAGFLTKVRA